MISNRDKIGGGAAAKGGGQYDVQSHILRPRKGRKIGTFGKFLEKIGSSDTFLALQAPKILRSSVF